MTKTFLFYDLETTGLNKALDQVLQFAAIRTDQEFNEIARHEWRIQLSPDVIPTPQASIIHRTSLASLESALNECEAMEKIHKLLNEPGTISLGYNTLGLDDEFLRFSFYRNLLPAYTHQYANQCGRADVFPITTLYYLFCNNALTWPMIDDKVSLKLENLAKANQFDCGQAHTAITDVEVTVSLAQKLRLHHPKMWQYAMDYFNKASDAKRIAELPKVIENCQLGLIVNTIFGFKQNYLAPVLGLGTHHYYKNQTVWLRLDLAELRETTKEDIKNTTWAIHKKMAEPGFILPPSERFVKPLDQERTTIMEENLAWLKEHVDILQAIADYYLNYQYPEVENIDIDAALYSDGFLSNHDQSQCTKFHDTPLEERAQLADEFSNEKLRQMAIRIIGRINPDLLNATQKELFHQHLQQVINGNVSDFKGNHRLSPNEALKEIIELKKQEIDTEQQQLLEELQLYLEAL